LEVSPHVVGDYWYSAANNSYDYASDEIGVAIADVADVPIFENEVTMSGSRRIPGVTFVHCGIDEGYCIDYAVQRADSAATDFIGIRGEGNLGNASVSWTLSPIGPPPTP